MWEHRLRSMNLPSPHRSAVDDARLPPGQAMSFREFMQRALYDPQRGYYTARIGTVGARGDFSTSATLATSLGKAIAAWLCELRRAVRCSRFSVIARPTTLIEIGAGNGQLMRTVLEALGWWQRRRLQVFIVETSPRLMEQQRALLGARVKWFPTMEAALQACAGEAHIVHNEVLDAFPVDLVQWQDGAWHEVWIDGQREVLRPLVLDPAPFIALRAAPAQTQRYELHTAAREWLQGWLPHWQRGTMLAIDYGGDFPALYRRRPRGTLRAYLMQQRLEGSDVYANPGRQDITCDVNFTDIRAWLDELGTNEVSYESQAAVLARHGVSARAGNEAFVQDAAGAGEAFRCLVVKR